MPITRRNLLRGGAATLALGPGRGLAQDALRLGLTPVLLDNDESITGHLRDALGLALSRPVETAQRRTYQEVVGLLLEGSVEAAWLCGYPFLQHEADLRILAVPVWRGRPLYQSYLIVQAGDPAVGLGNLRGGVHAFSDPDSNSGWLVTASDLARMGTDPGRFFARTIFCYGHRNVVRAVASGLARSGSVDGYVWEALATVEPDLARATRVIAKSEWLGFPPVVGRAGDEAVNAPLGQALLGLGDTGPGRDVLALLQLDGFQHADATLFDGIRARMRDVSRP